MKILIIRKEFKKIDIIKLFRLHINHVDIE